MASGDASGVSRVQSHGRRDDAPLQRIALEINYRCPAAIVAASARLIAHNTVRFPKRIDVAPGRADPGTITLRAVKRQIDAAADVARTLGSAQRGEIVVLARTTNALRPVALACADAGVAIDGPARLFVATGARRALTQHLQLAVAPRQADASLVAAVCQTPGRGLPQGAEAAIAAALEAGVGVRDAFADVPAPRRGRGALLAPGELFGELGELSDAGDAIALLRTGGGLDDWFAQEDRMGGLDEFESEVLEQAQGDARGLTLAAYLKRLERHAEQLAAVRDETHGIELATIHGSKGRQWPHVIVVACDDGTLPHARSREVDAEQQARGEGVEAERRLAYVAFTRAREHLELHHDAERPSPFLAEAGLLQADPPARRVARKAPPAPQPPGGPPVGPQRRRRDGEPLRTPDPRPRPRQHLRARSRPPRRAPGRPMHVTRSLRQRRRRSPGARSGAG